MQMEMPFLPSSFPAFLLSAFAFLLFAVSLFPNAQQHQNHRRQHTAELRATKGQLFVHMLHSAYFFPQTVDVKWSASAHGRPSLPHWLHLFPSRHPSIAFLVGTPVSPHSHFPIHVIARRIDSFQSAEQSFSIVTNDDIRFNGATQQIAEIRLTNLDAEELIWGFGRDGKLKSVEKAIHATFRGRNVNPYIYNILPGMANPPTLEVQHQLRRKINTGTILQVGTQRHFHSNVQQLARGMQLNPEFCVKNKLIPMDRHFRPTHIVDWCKFHLRNVTLLKELDVQGKGGMAKGENGRKGMLMKKEEEEVIEKEEGEGDEEEPGAVKHFHGIAKNDNDDDLEGVKRRNGIGKHKEREKENLLLMEQRQLPAPPVYYIWESVLVFPLLAVFCLLCILCLSFIFFGRREGQHWRDFKTPKNQLLQYLNLRESQQQLRDLSQQRQQQQQMAMMGSRSAVGGREQSDALSIGTFLRPRGSQSVQSAPDQSLALRQKPEFASGATLASGHSSIGKQTVAEAARANGSALHYYKHPIGGSADEDEEADAREREEESQNDEPKTGGGRRQRAANGRGWRQ